jgi:hypothetical protein
VPPHWHVLKRFNEQGRNVTGNKGMSFLSAIFPDEPNAKESKISKDAIAAAMTRLFAANKIRIDSYGPPSKERNKIAEVGS